MQMASNVMPGQYASWHNQRSDLEQRQALVRNIFNLFARRKPDVNQDWQRKLPDFIKRLEEALYRLARSREEYSDLDTLEYRLQQVARKMVNRPNQPTANSGLVQQASGSGIAQAGIHATAAHLQHDQQLQSPAQQQQLQTQQHDHHQQQQQHQQSQQQVSQSQPQPQPQQNGYGVSHSAAMNSQHASQSWNSGVASPHAVGANSMVPLQPAETLQSYGHLPNMQSSPIANGTSSPIGNRPLSSQPGIANGFRQQSLHIPQQQQQQQQSMPRHHQQQQQQPVGSMMHVKQEGGGISGVMPLESEAVAYPRPSLVKQQLQSGSGMNPQQFQPSTVPVGQMPHQNHLGMGNHGMQVGDAMRRSPSGQPPGSHLMSNGVPVLRGSRATAASQQAWPSIPQHIPNGHSQRMGGLVNSSGSDLQTMHGIKTEHQRHSHHSPLLNGGDSGMNGHASVSSAVPDGMVPVSSMYGMAGGISSSGPSMGGSPVGSLDQMSRLGDLPGSGLFKGGDAATERLPGTSSPAQIAASKKNYIAKQQRWLLFLRHCAKCQAPEHACQYGESCTIAKKLWRHILTCSGQQCPYPRCVASRELLKHHQKCTSSTCPVCTPVKQYVSRQRLAINSRTAQAAQPQQQQLDEMSRTYASQSSAHHSGSGNNDRGSDGANQPSAGVVPIVEQPPKRQKAFDPTENAGTSLLEAFNMKELSQHIESLESNTFKHSTDFSFPDDSVCKSCGQNRLTFDPPSLYCTYCGQRIKRNQVFYSPQVQKTMRASEVKGHWCHVCVSEAKETGLQQIDGSVIKTSDMLKKKNDEEMEEGWVQCDNCQGWVHQICGLFNKGRNDEDMPYQCPACLRAGLQNKQRTPIATRPQSMLEAKELPSCNLSQHLESRLLKAVAAERSARAARQGVPPESIQGAEGLTVRVVNNVDKVQEVKANFHDAFKTDGFPASLPYRQKVILLFQRIAGVDVCLYCVYTQEYGDSCPAPNTRWVYLAYIDSVKYFTPEQTVEAPKGSSVVTCALRTLVYHELLLAYLEYVKARGFTSMFIWACPPLQGDDYILYCHPNRQKTPRSDRLREWYHTLLRTAKERGTVTYVSNLFDTFFPGGKDHRLPKASAAHMPYLEGDYWPGEAENLLINIAEEHRQAGKRAKGSGGAAVAKPAFAPRSKGSAKGKRSAVAGSVDEALLGKLGEVVQGMKDDFMVVHFRESCSYCRKYLSDEARHRHPNPPQRIVRQERTFEGISLETPGSNAKAVLSMSRFQLCSDCHRTALQALSQSGSANGQGALPVGIQPEDLVEDYVEAIPATTDSGNPDMESEFFDTRQAFLSLCQGNHYQFDTMRRAKHSSMMVLYHLHNPQAPAFSCTCNTCGQEVAPGEGWRCTVCTDFDLCSTCASKGTALHPHRLMQHARKIDETRQRITEDERRDRAAQLQRTMRLLVHASGCRDSNCVSSNCHKIKELYEHARTCSVKVLGGCAKCRRMWALLQLHAKGCNESKCPVPRCRELRAMRRMQAKRQDEQRRTAYKAMLRNQNGTPTPN